MIQSEKCKIRKFRHLFFIGVVVVVVTVVDIKFNFSKNLGKQPEKGNSVEIFPSTHEQNMLN